MRTGKTIERFRNVSLPSSKGVRDAAVIALATLPVFLLFSRLEPFDWFYEFSRAHENWELDEIAAMTVYFVVALSLYAFRRHFELRSEMGQRIMAEREAARLARHDSLTGLPNRRHFRETFQSITSRAQQDCEFAVFVVDLDRFKPVNDVHGHEAGDAVLREVARRLTELAGDAAIVARLGGDEFGILCECQKDKDAAMRLAVRIVRELAKPIQAGPVTVTVGGSAGIALYPENAKDLDMLIRKADVAMYGAKQNGRSSYRFFSPGMDERLLERIALEKDLQQAIADGQIVPYYHPLVELESQKIIGFEVLARWQHKERGLLQPASFIALAEDTGLITPMTYALLRRACSEAKDWPSDLVISINLAPQQLTDPWLPQEILRILTECRFPARRLEIEITETALVQKLDEVKAALKSLRNLGVRVALDDFGTGYSGLYHLRELALDSLKIDRSFIKDMLSNREQARIVEAILGLSTALGLKTTAEGIESPEIQKRLTELGCQLGQGFYYGEPRPAEEITRDFVTQKLKRKSA